MVMKKEILLGTGYAWNILVGEKEQFKIQNKFKNLGIMH